MDLETLVVSFGADLTDLTRGVAGAKMLLTGFGLAALGVGAASVKMAGDFQASMTSLVTGAGESQKNIGLVSQGILKMATETGTSTKQLSDGMYMIESAGYHGQAGLDVLRAAAEGAKVGNADLGVVADGVTTIMTDYADKNVSAAAATNFLVATVASGKTHMQDLSASLASILPTASSVKVGLGDVMGAMATMTGEGVPAADAATYLRQTLMQLASPSKSGAKALEDIGLSAQQVSDSMKVSLPATLGMIMDHLKNKFPEGSIAFQDALKNIAGGSKQMQGMLDLTGTHLQTFKDNVDNISGAVKKGGSGISGWSDVQKDFNFKMDQAKAGVETLGIDIGSVLLPPLSNIVGAIGPILTNFDNWFVKSGLLQNTLNTLGTSIQNVSHFLNDHQGIILGVAGALTAFYIPAIIKSGVESVVAGAKMASQFITKIVMAGVEGYQAAAKLVLMVGQFIASGVQAVIAGAKMTASFIASIVKAGASAVVTAGQFIASLIPAIISFIAQSVVAAATAIPGMIAGFIAWTAGAWAAAAATIAATWPILAIIVAIGLLVGAIIYLWTHWSQVTAWVKAAWIVTTIILQEALKNVAHFFQNVWDGIVGGIKSGINWIIGAIDNFIDGVNKLGIDFGPIHIHPPKIPDIPKLAMGGVVPPGGMAVAGETGKPELVLGGTSGATVLGVSQTASLMRGGGGGKQTLVIPLIVNGHELARAVIDDLGEALLSGMRSAGHPVGGI